MSIPESNIESPSPIYPNLTTNSDSSNILTTVPNSYVSLLDSRETPGLIILFIYDSIN